MLNLFAPFAKVNTTEDGGREVWGFATLERVDKSGEIADFDGTLQAFQEWSSEIEKNTQGKSRGNLRVMHQPLTGGKVIDWQPGTTKVEDNGEEKEVRGIWVGSYIPPHKTDVIADIDSGVLSAYSIGGSYAKKWRDPKENATRFIPKMSELSIVDNPCVPGAEFQVIKADNGPWENNTMDKSAPKGSYEELRERLEESCRIVFGGPFRMWDGWVCTTYPDHFVVRDWERDAYFDIPYQISGDEITLGEPKEVEEVTGYIPVDAQKAVEAEMAKRASEKDELRAKAEERAKAHGISFKEGKGHLTPPSGKPTDESEYGDPVNYAYPIDSSHIKAAVSYFNQDGQREDGGYSEEEWSKIGHRIAAAASRLEGGEYKYESGKITTPNNSKGSDESVSKDAGLTAEQLSSAALAAGINLEQMTKFLAELSKAPPSTPGGKVDGDGDNDNNKEFPNKDEGAPDKDKAAADAKKDEGDGGGGMGEAAKDDGDMEMAQKFVSDIVGDELSKAGATISEATREKLHKAASHIHDTCKCAKCMKAASIYADENGTNNGEEPQQPPVKKEELAADLQKAVGISFAETLEKAGFAKQEELTKFASDVGELTKGVTAITEALQKVSESVEAVSKSVKAIEEAPTQGGPLLMGAAGVGGTPPLQKSEQQSEYEALEKAHQATTDLNLKDVLGRKLAVLQHKQIQNKGSV